MMADNVESGLTELKLDINSIPKDITIYSTDNTPHRHVIGKVVVLNVLTIILMGVLFKSKK